MKKQKELKRKSYGVKIILILICTDILFYVSTNCLTKWTTGRGITSDPVPLIVITIFLIFFNALWGIMLKNDFDMKDKIKHSKEIVDKHLSKEKLVEVIPIKVSAIEYESFIFELTKRAVFYAEIDDEESIIVGIKFNNEDDIEYFQNISKKEFADYYEIANNNTEQITN